MNKDDIKKDPLGTVGQFISATFIATIFSLVWAFVVVWTWNYIMPYLFGLPTIEWLSAFCLLLLARAIFPKR